MWEDENTLCYQVEANGVTVVRRADNDMINGTKLLNVTRMTRGRRDGILKAEKIRHVVKIGSMHLKGVWIPFERALVMAQREKIVDLLYPLFVRDIQSIIQQESNGKYQQPHQHHQTLISTPQQNSLPHNNVQNTPSSHIMSISQAGVVMQQGSSYDQNQHLSGSNANIKEVQDDNSHQQSLRPFPNGPNHTQMHHHHGSSQGTNNDINGSSNNQLDGSSASEKPNNIATSIKD